VLLLKSWPDVIPFIFRCQHVSGKNVKEKNIDQLLYDKNGNCTKKRGCPAPRG
jgi:hypothetical protein